MDVLAPYKTFSYRTTFLATLLAIISGCAFIAGAVMLGIGGARHSKPDTFASNIDALKKFQYDWTSGTSADSNYTSADNSYTAFERAAYHVQLTSKAGMAPPPPNWNTYNCSARTLELLLDKSTIDNYDTDMASADAAPLLKLAPQRRFALPRGNLTAGQFAACRFQVELFVRAPGAPQSTARSLGVLPAPDDTTSGSTFIHYKSVGIAAIGSLENNTGGQYNCHKDVWTPPKDATYYEDACQNAVFGYMECMYKCQVSRAATTATRIRVPCNGAGCCVGILAG